MKMNKLEGIKFLKNFGLPTVKLIEIPQILSGKLDISDGISIRVSPKKNDEINVYLPSIHNSIDVEEIRNFVECNLDKYEIFAHKTVKADKIGSISKLNFNNRIIIELYNNYEDRKKEVVSNRMSVIAFENRILSNNMEVLKKVKSDVEDFKKVLQYLKYIPFQEYNMEFIIENRNIIFTELTVKM